MDSNNTFGFVYTALDVASSGNTPDYAPSFYTQQEQEPQQAQDISAFTHTDPSNPFGLGFGNDGGSAGTAPNNAFTRLMNRVAAQEAQQQQTLMSSHTDPNPADIPDDDPSEIERIRNRYARLEEKLKIMKTLVERDAVPGGTMGRRGEQHVTGGMFDFGQEEEDDHIGENMNEDYGNGAWEVREGRQFNRVSPPLRDDDEYRRRGHLRHEDDEGFDPLDATPLNLLGMGGGGHSLPGGDGVTRRKRLGFHRQTETSYREFAGGGRQHPTQQKRDNAKNDYDRQSDLPGPTIMYDKPRHLAAANTHPAAAGGRGNLLDRASASLGLNPTAGSLSMGPVLGYPGPPLPPGSANQPPNTNMGHSRRPFQPFGASQPANPMLIPFLNPQSLPSGFRPVGANLPEGSRIRHDGRPYAPGRGVPRPVPVSAFPLMGTKTRPIRWNRFDGMASDDEDDEYESYD